MPYVSHTATFSPDDRLARILEDLACPACGNLDPGEAHKRISRNRLRIFCEDCGTFVTVLVSDEQANAIRRWLNVTPADPGSVLAAPSAPMA